MAYMLQVGKSNLQRIFLALVVFVEAIFSRLSLKPDNWFFSYNMHEVFIETGQSLRDINPLTTGVH